MNNQRVIELPKSGLIRWLVLGLVAIVGVCCVVVFMLPFALGDAQYLNKSIQLSRTGVTMTGAVSEVEESKSSPVYGTQGREVSYRYTVEYTVGGQTYSVRNQKFTNILYKVGDPLEVIYDPADPATAQVNFFSERWVDPILAMIPF